MDRPKLSTTYTTIVRNAGVFATWTVTSFLCHQLGKKFLEASSSNVNDVNGLQKENTRISSSSSSSSETRLFSSTTTGLADVLTSFWQVLGPPITLTTWQLAFCALFVTFEKKESSSSISRGRETTVKILHALATLATNISLALVPSSSTFAIKMLEPVTSAFVQYVWMGVATSCVSLSSLPFIVGGAIAFAGNPLETSHTASGMMGALMSNILLTFRNVEMKKLTPSPSSPPLRYGLQRGAIWPTVSILCICVVINLLSFGSIDSAIIARTLLFVDMSALFHVVYSYVSTSLVLPQVSVLTHAVANIMKRLLVVLLLYAFGRRAATPWNFAGLAVCFIGLLVFAGDKSRSHKNTQSDHFHKGWTYIQITSLRKYSKQVLSVLVIACLTAIIVKEWWTIRFRNHSDTTAYFWNQKDITAHAEVDFIDARHFEKRHLTQLLSNLDNLPQPPPKQLVRRSNNDVLPKNAIHKSEELKDIILLPKEYSTSEDIIKQAQDLHFSILGKVLRKFKYAFFVDIPRHENKGDSAITVGEIYFLARMNITVKFYCGGKFCFGANLKKAIKLAKQYSPDDLVILCHGGGNIIGYPHFDNFRFNIFKSLSAYKFLIFPQSIWVRNWLDPHVSLAMKEYCCNPNLTIVLRDAVSFKYASMIFNGSTRLLLAPDMAFQIGHYPRFMDPMFDVMWIKRGDVETPGYSIPENVLDYNITVHVSDWTHMKTSAARKSVEWAVYATTMGFFFLQRGRVVITDRLHGHILATLMDIPHVLIDNGPKKLSNYHLSWTRTLDNTVLTDDPNKAMALALQLLQKYKKTLPATVPFINVPEDLWRYEKRLLKHP